MSNLRKAETIYDKLDRINYKWLYLMFLIILIIPSIFPITLPITVSQNAIDFKNEIDNFPPGSTILWIEGFAPTAYANIPGLVATMKYVFEKDLKVVFYCLKPDGPLLDDEKLKTIAPKYNKIYGEDYVLLGYLSGFESAIITMNTDMRKAFTQDYYYTPIDEIPLMENINSIEDIDLVVYSYQHAEWLGWVNRQIYAQYDVPIIVLSSEAMRAVGIIDYEAGMIKGITFGIPGGNELEVLFDIPGEASAINNLKSLAVILTLGFVLLGNIAYFGKKYSKRVVVK